MILLYFIWIIATLLLVSIGVLIGKKYGVEYIIALNATLVVIASILANKIIALGPFTAPAGILVFSMTFLITDIIAEKWGKKIAQKAVWAGLMANVILIISLYIATSWTPASFALAQSEMFAKVLILTPRIILGSIIAYLVSQNMDIFLFHFLKNKTKKKHLWLRNNVSTIISQLIDSSIFIVIAFYGVFPVIPLILGQWVLKVIIALLDTPFIYGIIHFLNRK